MMIGSRIKPVGKIFDRRRCHFLSSYGLFKAGMQNNKKWVLDLPIWEAYVLFPMNGVFLNRSRACVSIFFAPKMLHQFPPQKVSEETHLLISNQTPHTKEA